MRSALEGLGFGVGLMIVFKVSLPVSVGVFLACVAVSSFTVDCVRIVRERTT